MEIPKYPFHVACLRGEISARRRLAVQLLLGIRRNGVAMDKKETRSPIKNLPVRMPGQSTRERQRDLVDDVLVPWFFGAGMMVMLAAYEWVAYYNHLPPQPVVLSVIAVIAVGLAFWKIRAAFMLARQLRLGALGEEAVGQYLDESLRRSGCQVFHDVLGEDFNVDHIVVGPTGVFAVETKTHSKPARGPCIVQYDGEKVTVNGYVPDRDPVIQAKAEAKWVSDLLEQSTGRRFFVKPIVLYPGWYVESSKHNAEVWVLNETGLPKYIGGSHGRSLSSEEINMISFHLKRYVISREGV